jgi:hypothetical protein
MKLRPTGLHVDTLDGNHTLTLSASAHEGEVVIQLGDTPVKMSPADAQRFGFYLAAAYVECGRWEPHVDRYRPARRRLVLEEGEASC